MIILGLCVGSFLNVVICRFPKGESIVFPSSHCPICKYPIKAYDNIPILSWIILKGKCRKCNCRIPLRYPVIELTTGMLFGIQYFLYLKNFSSNLELIPLFIFVSVLYSQSVIDIETQMLPFSLSLFGIFTGLLWALFRNTWWDYYLACAAGFAIMGMIGLVGKYIYKKEAMGGGDLVFAAFLGSFLGVKNMVTALFIAFFVSGIFAIFFLVSGMKGRKDEFPLGPFLALGGFLSQPFMNISEGLRKYFGF